MNLPPPRSPQARQRGASMIEVLVSILIVSMGILALAGLLGVSSRVSKTSEFRAVASLLVADIADRIRANIPGAGTGGYDLASAALASAAPSAAPACAVVTLCTADELAAIDMAEWQALVFNSLPQGTGYVAYTAETGVADVWIAWQDPKAQAVGTQADNTLIDDGIERRCPPGFSTTGSPSCMFFRIGL